MHDDLADGCVEYDVLQQVAAVVGEAKGRLLVVLCVQVDLVLDAAALTFALLCGLHSEAEFADDIKNGTLGGRLSHDHLHTAAPNQPVVDLCH